MFFLKGKNQNTAMPRPARVAPSRPRPSSGFTLMEMLVVIAIMGAILALVTGFGPPRSHRLLAEAAARNLADAMRDARGQAIAQGHPVALIMPPSPAWLTVSIDAPPGGIVFFPDGSSTGGSVLLRGDGRATDVVADWLTGRVQINGP